MKTVGPQHELFIVTEGATVIRVKTDEISQTGRATQGVKMMTVDDNDRICAVARMTGRQGEARRRRRRGRKPTPKRPPVDLGDGNDMARGSPRRVSSPLRSKTSDPIYRRSAHLRADRFLKTLGPHGRRADEMVLVCREFRTQRRPLNVAFVLRRTVRAANQNHLVSPATTPLQRFQKSC